MLVSQISNGRPALKVTVGSKLGAVQDVLVLIDTGCSADLVIPQDLADQLGIKGEYIESIGLAVGTAVPMWVGAAYVSLEGVTKEVAVLIGGKQAIGTSLLTRFQYTLNINFVTGSIILDKEQPQAIKEDYEDDG